MSYTFGQPSQEKVDQAIEKLANLIARKYRTPEPAVFFLESIKPIAPIVRQEMFFALFPYIPIFDALPGIEDSDTTTMKYLDILDKEENIEKLIRRLEEITKEVKEEEFREKQNSKSNISTLTKVKSWLRKQR